MVRVRKPQYAGETQLASFCKLFDIHIYPAHNYQLLSGHWGQFRNSNQEHLLLQHSIVKEKGINEIPVEWQRCTLSSFGRGVQMLCPKHLGMREVCKTWTWELN